MHNELKDKPIPTHQIEADLKRNRRLALRHSFIALYRRDKLHLPLSPKDTALLAHFHPTSDLSHKPRGNIKADLSLYLNRLRDDPEVFEDLYGVSVPVAAGVRDWDTLEMLKAHATIKASYHRTATVEFEVRFREYLDALDRAGWPLDYVGDWVDAIVNNVVEEGEEVAIVALRRAYVAFHRAIGEDVF
ncbi:hypothetical protein BDV25DRAFT_135609 [Aspergillus avenaceus]|uniref:Uncharacterized protein n=1 Tax=Aspergillus avenaceus TaxID=36643 RepID=A0A5N6U7Y3_ASPAV|nr:hypothetical protein BDV25DRAFT_135609 [Aspergillus avenaceus]